jgi:HAE1 family hydrophobic/amphiphilic exporter-1
MTSFAFIAGLLPLVFATGPGKIGNRTIGTAAAGGMLIGIIVYVIPGLYYIFGRIAEKYKLVKVNPLTEEIDNNEVHK